MERKETAQTMNSLSHAKAPASRHVPAKGELEGILKSGGYDSGRLFHSRERATYTFLHGTEVVSLHFDLTKQVLYLKGHRVTSLEDHDCLEEFLGRFKKALREEKSAHTFLAPFDAALSRLTRL